MSTTVIHQPLSDSDADRAIAEAQNTPCNIANCNGWQHEEGVMPSEWSHEVVSDAFDGGTVSAAAVITKGNVTGYLDYQACGDMTAADFRAEADTYEAFPAWLRSMADRMDALNA